MKLVYSGSVKKRDEKVKDYLLKKGIKKSDLYPHECAIFDGKRSNAKYLDWFKTGCTYAFLALICGVARFEILAHSNNTSVVDKTANRSAVDDYSITTTGIVARAQGRALDAESEKMIDAKVKTFAADYFPGLQLTGLTWIENYQKVAAQMLQPENARNLTLKNKYQLLNISINATLDNKPFKGLNQDSLQNIPGFQTPQPTLFDQANP